MAFYLHRLYFYFCLPKGKELLCVSHVYIRGSVCETQGSSCLLFPALDDRCALSGTQVLVCAQRACQKCCIVPLASTSQILNQYVQIVSFLDYYWEI